MHCDLESMLIRYVMHDLTGQGILLLRVEAVACCHMTVSKTRATIESQTHPLNLASRISILIFGHLST